MVDDNDNENEIPEDEPSFAELLDAYEGRSEDSLQVGDKLSVRVIAIGKDAVFVDTGTKIDGSVERSELLDDDGHLTCEVGDTLDLFVVARSEGEIRLSRALSGFGGLQMLQEAHDSQIPVEGKVQATCKGGFDVRILQQRAFCPVSQIDIRYVETPEDYVGQTLSFLVTQFEARGRNIVVSRRRLLEKEREAAREAFMAELVVLLSFGCIAEYFVGFGGFFKFFFNFFVVRVSIRVVLHIQLTVSFFNFIFSGVSVYTENFVIISFSHLVYFSFSEVESAVSASEI